MNDMDIDSSSLARELGDYETNNPDVHTDYGEDFSVGDDLSSQRYDGNGDISARDNIKNKIKGSGNNNRADDDEVDLESLGYKSPDVGDDEGNEETGTERSSEEGRPRRTKEGNNYRGGVAGVIHNLISAIIVAGICYFIILPMLLFALRSAFGIQPQWYDNYQDISDRYYNKDNTNTDLEQPITELKNIRDHVSDTFTDVTGLDLRPKLEEGKTVLMAPFVVGTNGNDIRVFINGDEYSIDVSAVDMLAEKANNRAQIEVSVLDREIVAVKFISFESVVEGVKEGE